MKHLSVKGFKIFRSFLTPEACTSLVDELRDVARAAPFRAPETRFGKQMSVRMTSAGRLGWWSDRGGYRYEPHQSSGEGWPDIPEAALTVWSELVSADRRPDSCLVNFYGEGARMGMHQDRDEGDFSWPVVSISLGDDALFRMGTTERKGASQSLWLSSGDVVVMGGAARLAFHGIDKIRFGSSTLLPQGGRLNVTLRVVDQGASEQQP